MKIYMAVKMQALAMAMARSTRDPFTVHDLHTKAKSAGLESQDHHAVAAVRALYKAGELQRVRLGFGRSQYGYVLAAKHGKPTPPATPIVEEPTKDVPAGVSVELVKSTGKLRIQFRGLVVDIGIVE